jgi:hypothetical protein
VRGGGASSGMRQANVVSGATRMEQALKTLRLKWETVAQTWTDSVRADFEKDVLIPLERQITSTTRAIADLGEILTKVHRDCE